MLPIDPDADRSRRAWVACPNCDHGVGCQDCLQGRNCPAHWQYLISNHATVVHLQCPSCTHLWSLDTRTRRRVA
ncbi:hypothetical protein MBOT_31860 [Mycobacterium botniense]|uniref:Uncharacterized protein n=1 Tax=Mycobacterium botniense TaxID=84962 RepID=A0A7I9Y180_9MYCO|nr:hypothetical protein MBOT_31860 [Mycobacterium botniense]